MSFYQITPHKHVISTSSTLEAHEEASTGSDAALALVYELGGTSSDRIRRILCDNAIINSKGELLTSSDTREIPSTLGPLPKFLTEPLQLIPTNSQLQPATVTPEAIVKALFDEIQSVIPVNKVYLYGGLLREELNAERTQELLSAMTDVKIPLFLIPEPQERVPDADVAIHVTLLNQNSYFALRATILRVLAKLYPNNGIYPHEHEQLVLKYGYQTFIDPGFGSDDPNQFFLIRLGGGEQKNLEIKIWWKLARPNLFTVTGWQSDWDCKTNSLGPIYHSDSTLTSSIIDWCTRQLRAKNPETINHKGWARYQTLLCSGYRSNQIDLEPILWTTLNNTLAHERSHSLLRELVQCLEVHYPNDYNFAIRYLLHVSLILRRQGDLVLVDALWSGPTWERLISTNKCPYAQVLYTALTTEGSTVSPLWKGIASWLFQQPSSLAIIADLFALSAFLKLGELLEQDDPMEQVELTSHRNELCWQFKFKSAHHSTLLLPVDANCGALALNWINQSAEVSDGNAKAVIEALFTLPTTCTSDKRRRQLGLNMQALRGMAVNESSLMQLALRLKIDELEQRPLEPDSLETICRLVRNQILPPSKVMRLAYLFRQWSFPMTEKALLLRNARSEALELAMLCDLAATKDSVAVRFAAARFAVMPIDQLPAPFVKGTLLLVRTIALSSIDLALQSFQKCCEGGMFAANADLGADGFVHLAGLFKSHVNESEIQQLASAQTLTRFQRCSLKLAHSEQVSSKAESFRDACESLLLKAAKNTHFASVNRESAWNWFTRMRNVMHSSHESELLAAFLDEALANTNLHEELDPIWRAIENSGVLQADGPIPQEWVERCLMLLERTVQVRWHAVPQSDLWNRLKRSDLSQAQAQRFAECTRYYGNQLMQQNAWTLALAHHSSHPHYDEESFQTWFELFKHIRRNGQGSVWMYASQVCAAADRTNQKCKDQAFAFYLELLPANVNTKSSATAEFAFVKEQLAFTKWCAKTLASGEAPASARLDSAVLLLKRIENWQIDGLIENSFTKLLMPLVAKAGSPERCLPESVRTIRALAAKYSNSIDDEGRGGLLHFVLANETVENSWTYTYQSLNQWQSPLVPDTAQTMLELCARNWNAATLQATVRYEQLQNILARCGSRATLEAIATLKTNLMLSIIDTAMEQKNPTFAWELLQELNDPEDAKAVTERRHKCLAQKIAKKSVEEVLSFLGEALDKDSDGAWAEWEVEWLKLTDITHSSAVSKRIVDALRPHINRIRASDQLKKWSSNLLALITQISNSATDVSTTLALIADFKGLLPPLSHKLMKHIVFGLVAAKRSEEAENYLGRWAKAVEFEKQQPAPVRMVWVEYLSSVPPRGINELLDWLELNSALFLKLEPSCEDRISIGFKLTAHSAFVLSETEDSGMRGQQILGMLAVSQHSASDPALYPHWVKCMAEYLKKICAIDSYKRLLEVLTHLKSYFPAINTEETRTTLISVFAIWFEAVAEFVAKRGATSQTIDLTDRALRTLFTDTRLPLFNSELPSANSVPTANSKAAETLHKTLLEIDKTFIVLLTNLGRGTPCFYEWNQTIIRMFSVNANRPRIIPYVVKFIARWLHSTNHTDTEFAMTVLQRCTARCKDPTLFYEPIEQAATPLLNSTDNASNRAGLLLACYISWAGFIKSKPHLVSKEFINLINVKMAHLLVRNGMDDPYFVRGNSFRQASLKNLATSNELSVDLFIRTQLELVMLMLAHVEANPTRAPDLVVIACIEAIFALRIQRRSDTSTNCLVKIIHNCIQQEGLLPLQNEASAMVGCAYAELMGLAVEKGVFKENDEVYDTFFRTLFNRPPPHPIPALIPENLDIVRADQWTASCQLAEKLDSKDMTDFLYGEMVQNLHFEVVLRGDEMRKVAFKYMGFLSPFVLHRVRSMTDRALGSLALTQALTVLIQMILAGVFKSNPALYTVIYVLIFEKEPEIRLVGMQQNSRVILHLVKEIISHNKNIANVPGTVLPQVITLLKEHAQTLILMQADEFMDVFDYLISHTILSQDLIDSDEVMDIFHTGLRSGLYKVRPKMALAHGLLLQSVDPVYIDTVKAFPQHELYELLTMMLLRFGRNNNTHPHFVAKALEIFNYALATYRIVPTGDALYGFYLSLIAIPPIYLNNDFENGIANVNQMMQGSLGALNRGTHFTPKVLARLFSLIDKGFLSRDTEFEQACAQDQATTCNAAYRVFKEISMAFQDISSAVGDLDYFKYMSVWYEAVIDKIILYHSKAPFQEYRGILNPLMGEFQHRCSRLTIDPEAQPQIRVLLERLKEKIDRAFPSESEPASTTLLGLSRDHQTAIYRFLVALNPVASSTTTNTAEKTTD